MLNLYFGSEQKTKQRLCNNTDDHYHDSLKQYIQTSAYKNSTNHQDLILSKQIRVIESKKGILENDKTIRVLDEEAPKESSNNKMIQEQNCEDLIAECQKIRVIDTKSQNNTMDCISYQQDSNKNTNPEYLQCQNYIKQFAALGDASTANKLDSIVLKMEEKTTEQRTQPNQLIENTTSINKCNDQSHNKKMVYYKKPKPRQKRVEPQNVVPQKLFENLAQPSNLNENEVGKSCSFGNKSKTHQCQSNKQKAEAINQLSSLTKQQELAQLTAMEQYERKKKEKRYLDEISQHLKRDYFRVGSYQFKMGECQLFSYALSCGKQYLREAIDYLQQNWTTFGKIWVVMSPTNNLMTFLIKHKVCQEAVEVTQALRMTSLELHILRKGKQFFNNYTGIRGQFNESKCFDFFLNGKSKQAFWNNVQDLLKFSK